VKRLQKDPSLRVRAAALHAEHDACEIETIEAGLAPVPPADAAPG